MLSCLLSVVIILTTNLTAFAARTSLDGVPDPPFYWKYTSMVGLDLYINNGKAELSATVKGYSGVTHITAEAVLERQNLDGTYTKLASWDNISAQGRYLNWYAVRYVSKGYTYRFTINVTVYKDGESEEVSGSKYMSY
jgi:hypothetical protein